MSSNLHPVNDFRTLLSPHDIPLDAITFGAFSRGCVTTNVTERPRYHSSLSQYIVPRNKKPRLCTTQYDFVYSTGRGRVTLYDPERHGVWEISETADAKLVVRLAHEAVDEAGLVETANDNQSGIFARIIDPGL